MNRIPEVHKEKGIKQAQLVKVLGLTRSCISQYYSCKVDVPASKLTAMCIVLDCEIRDIV